MIQIPYQPPPWDRFPGAEFRRDDRDRFLRVFEQMYCFVCAGNEHEDWVRRRTRCALRPTRTVGRLWMCDDCWFRYRERDGNMPHYVDGTEAKIGDVVRGKPYNTPHEVVGTIVQVTPGTESCNCVVAFAVLRTRTREQAEALGERGVQTFTTNDGRIIEPFARTDYGETKAFALINRPEQ